MTLHHDLVGLFRTMNERLPTGEHEAHFWELYKEAEKYYLKTIELSSSSTGSPSELSLKAMNNLGLLYYDQDKKNDAVKYLKTAVDNGYIDAAFDLGLIYSQLGDKANAESYLKISVEKAKNDRALYNLGVIYYDQGKNDLAKKYLKMAADKGDKDARLMLDGM